MRGEKRGTTIVESVPSMSSSSAARDASPCPSLPWSTARSRATPSPPLPPSASTRRRRGMRDNPRFPRRLLHGSIASKQGPARVYVPLRERRSYRILESAVATTRRSLASMTDSNTSHTPNNAPGQLSEAGV
ncbi:hypothetical protein OUZ56_017162 [Daphnia magna]|uniref:Uncharacterized protein n=1 Tax=Daphnia magna TaxID=35525 RepID=A0ABR0ASA9_9CRUS|nr:hypothetical protein OUZ56_017162 [Daphnia magna]